MMLEYFYPGGEDVTLGIEGCKYWFQYRAGNEEVGFHFDKDEGQASDQQRMRFPYINTLLYLRGEGAPTVFFNQTVIHNGNVMIPPVPNEAFVVYPKRNKWAVQRGDLNHGAHPSMAADPVTPGERRITFVLSFEDRKPAEPNCHELTGAELPTAVRASMRNPAVRGARIDRAVISKGAIVRSDMTDPDPTTGKYLSLDIGGEYETLRFKMPPSGHFASQSTTYVQWSLDSMRLVVEWLDVTDERMMSRFVWNTPPGVGVALLFMRRRASTHEKNLELAHARVLRQMWDADARRHVTASARPLNFLNVHAGGTAADAMEFLGVQPEECPTAVVHFPNPTDRVYKMGPSYKPTTQRSLLAFYTDVLEGRLEPDVLPRDEV